ncbi:MAG: lipopolysaccharide heptosyltransferase II [bacterium]
MKRALVIRMSSLGDLILSTPVAEAIKKEIPNAFLAWIVEKNNAPILTNNPYVDEILIWDKSIAGILKLIRALRRHKWDLCLDLQSLFKSALFSLLSGAKVRIGLEKVERGSHIFYNFTLPNIPSFHALQNNLLSAYLSIDFLKRGKIDIKKGLDKLYKAEGNFKPKIYPSPMEREKANELIKGYLPFVALCPGTTWESKRWNAKKWAELADFFLEKHYKVVFIGGRKDIPHIREIKSYMRGNSLDLSGKTSILEAGCILESAELAISVDSGAMHLATAVDTPVIALFGPTNPKIQGPYGEKNKVVYKGLSCSPCRRRECPAKDCMNLITTEEVIEQARVFLSF